MYLCREAYSCIQLCMVVCCCIAVQNVPGKLQRFLLLFCTKIHQHHVHGYGRTTAQTGPDVIIETLRPTHPKKSMMTVRVTE